MIHKTIKNIFTFCLVLSFPALLLADGVFDKNSEGNRMYKKGKYEEALKQYDNALLEAPADVNLKNNRGLALYKQGQFEEAIKALTDATGATDKNVAAAAWYNLGNANFRAAQQQAGQNQGQGGNPKEKITAARDAYIQALDLNSKDRNAKWNLQIAQEVLKQLKDQPQDSNQNKDDKNQNKDNKDQQKNQQDQKKNDQNQQDKNKQDEQNQDNQDKQNQDKNKDQQKQDQNKDQQNSQNDKDKQDMKKQEAAKLLEQYKDDDDKLNKPVRTGVLRERRPEKDW